MTRVLIVEDQALPRQLFEMYVSQSDKYELVRSITNADMAPLICEQYKVDLVLMDVCTDMGASGIDSCGVIKRKYPDIKVIVVTSMPEHSFIEKAKRAGADSFWYKEISEEPIISLMDRTMNGEKIYPDSTPVFMIGNMRTDEFTKREIEILSLLMDGLTNKEISEILGISDGTVKGRVNDMLAKTGFKTRTALAVELQKTGFILNDF